MSLDQKIGQMTLVKFAMLKNDMKAENPVIDWNNLRKHNIGAMLVAGGEVPHGKGVIAGTNNQPDSFNG